MRVAVLATCLALGGGCGIPFDVVRAAHLAVPLGPLVPGCADDSSNGDVDGVTGAFTRHHAADGCRLTSRFHGPLLDLKDAKREVPDGVSVDDVEIEDAVAHLDDAPGLTRLIARVGVLGNDDVVVVRAGPDQSRAPDVATAVPPALVSDVDDAWQHGAPVDAQGDVDATFTPAETPTAAAPVLLLDFQIRVRGTADPTAAAGAAVFPGDRP